MKEKKINKNCEFIYMCPIHLKCKINGIYIRKETGKCVCRDIIKNLKKNENTTNNSR